MTGLQKLQTPEPAMPRRSSVDVAFSSSTRARIRPPDDLAGPERKLFIDLAVACRADHFENSDVALLVVFCNALVLEKVALAGLKSDGYVTAEGRPSGWLNILAQATRVISTYSRMLRLNPSARHATPASSEPEPISYYEKMSLERGDDGRN
jgi:phage terminase small subunit